MKRPLRTAALAFLLAGSAMPARAAFEQIGAGARPIGMASAFTAVADDAHAVYYNPAGLAQVRRGEMTAGYGKLFAGLKDNSNLGSGFLGIAQPLKSGKLGTLGVGWLSLNLQNAYREDVIGLSYGKELWVDGLFLGATGKILKRKFGSDIYTAVDPLFAQHGYNTSNVSADLAMMYRPSASFSFGLMLKDLNQPNVGLASEDKVPAEIRGGFAYRQKRLTFDGDISRKDKDLNVSVGIERLLLKFVGLRAGVTAGSRQRREITAGMSYNGNYFSLDYAFIFPLSGIESTSGSHRFGLTVRFGRRHSRARWEFEEDEEVIARILEEKAAQITSMEKELEDLRDQNRSGKLENSWVRKQIERLEGRLKDRESQDLEEMKLRVNQSNVETENMKQKLQELEDRLRRLSAPRPAAPKAAEVQAPAEEKKLPPVPRTYIVQEGDTLQSIAFKFYGDDAKWSEIYKINSDRIERGGTLRTGQILLMPQY
ncbi:MAG: hypothetical protein A2902_05170 [Elusimicrobia bacterium RIFCSPLOWO2_01_FULL_64_13]|nr:MAG: hypothetical protein A2636_04390 [Elusimicrobia bacterium RIFCSPHIGHO2_01_FULL_64_10]OGR96256.1 MAG: hypothetical protein A2902_05170 [Elusimicrobia bacterium RIFCSPLOWO2_01_FULL_64_13]